MGGLKTISIIVAANIKGLESGLGKANKSLSKFASTSARIGSMMSFGITAPMTAMGKAAFDTFSKFENGMTKVKTVTGASVSDFKMLTEEAKRLGATTQFTASQVADLQLVLGRKGFDPTAIKNMEKSILDLALATGEDLSLAADTVASSINAFGLKSSDASSVANTLASAAANSSIQLSTFATAFGHAGASASAVGVDIEELSAMMGVLMDNGIKASKAGTGLRKAFMKLNESGVPFGETLDKLTKGTMSLNQAERLVGVTGANQLMILAKQRKRTAELTKEYKNNKGRLKEMADEMGKTTTARVKKMESAIEGLKLEFGALIADAITPLIDYITDVARKFTDLDDNTKNLIIRVGGIMAVIGPVLIGFGALLSMLNPISIGLIAVTGAIAAFTGASKDSTSQIEDENEALNNLAERTLSAKEGTEERLKLIKQLQDEYPDFLGNLDAEKVSNEDIEKSLAGANKEFLAKIRLQAESEKLQDLIAVKAEKGRELIDKENETLSSLRDLYKDSGKEIDKSLSTQDKLDEALGGLEGTMIKLDHKTRQWIGSFGDKSVLPDTRHDLIDLDHELDNSQKAFNEAESAVEEYLAILRDMGSTVGQVETPEVKPKIDTSSTMLPEIILKPSMIQNFSDGLNKMSEKVLAFSEKYSTAFSMMGQISSQFIANRQIENENWYKKQKELIDGSTKSEEEKAEALASLDQKMADKTAKLKKKQAKADKRAAIFEATINTATAITKAYPNIFLAGLVAALGAVQVAAIASQPIPAFADGGEPPVGRVSLVGERGPELFVPKSRGTIIPNHMLGGGSQNVSVQVYGTLDSEGIQIATVQGNEIAKQKGNPTL